MLTDANFDSMDWLEDATDTLDESDFQYILIVPTSPNRTVIYSRVNREERAAIASQIRESNAIEDHFKELEANETQL